MLAATEEHGVLLRVRTFGECVMHAGDRNIGPDGEIIFALLLILVFERGERVPRERLRQLLWPGVAQQREWHCGRFLTEIWRSIRKPGST